MEKHGFQKKTTLAWEGPEPFRCYESGYGNRRDRYIIEGRSRRLASFLLVVSGEICGSVVKFGNVNKIIVKLIKSAESNCFILLSGIFGDEHLL